MMETNEQDFWFTFGFNHAHPHGYTVIHGTVDSSREEMYRRYGNKWSMQYRSAEDAGVEKYKLTEVK
jgi:hypothetical protein